ncbi:hypothetical protein HMPREF3198_01633 [Winkia neuii]|nr:hypothetical protein HMPREF3198_01633 [Winkia neuii]OFJ71712.1 hypothetical protein HMPREF2851_06060 [Actinomyces sp. HMSC064C12]
MHTKVPVGWVRLVFALASLTGISFPIYLWLWISIPVGDPWASSQSERRIQAGALSKTLAEKQSAAPDEYAPKRIMLAVGIFAVCAGSAISIGYPSLTELSPVAWTGILVASGVILIWGQRDLGQRSSGKTIAALGGGILLVAVGVVNLVGRAVGVVGPFNSAVVALAMLAGIGAAIAPVWVRLTDELGKSRAEQVREATRADIAAHLHDSVLQTLALIRARAEDPVAVRTLARRQERELRTWLYQGEESQYDSVVALVGAKIAEVEDRYGVAIEYVHVSDLKPGPFTHAAGPIIQEACQNAAAHGKPPISVYLECSGKSLQAWVKDRGTGFDLDNVPPDRHGVRDSILGRAERLGGIATINSSEAGTEIYLSLEDK